MPESTLIMQAIGLGLVLSLVFSEILGLAAGGMVVPGYVALMIHQPLRILGTIVVALITFLTVRFMSNHMFLYGRRRTVMIILVGFCFGWASRELFVISPMNLTIEFQTIGYIIPGLIANWMERQGVIQTITMMIVAGVLVRMLLMIFTGGEVIL
ncbi:MAG: poly-gamma-glutamate biosynthesis protein PgsC [candidate division Zixibacteria bacterium]|nr:poly-gamma-glutamate biosynthesis protein PgsC [candidate division Zixibacteria bacterium]